MKKFFLLFSFLVVVPVISGCSLFGNPATNSGKTPSQNSNMMTVPNGSSQNSGVAIEGNAINIQNFAFIPATLDIKKGTTVTWTNNDSVSHQIKSSTFNSDLLSQGQSFSFTFNDTGSFDYSCAIHPSMKGKIIVQ